ncbi:MAG: translational GTPase TypA [Candidatus Riflebacteria bacterium]|nr:translational GTPase TypA [Candidatus Riflebacteria bacterium]
MNPESIRNLAIIAHVDHGKTTLVDAMIKQSGLFRDSRLVEDRFMDSNDLEKERGITILSKNLSLEYNGYRINLIDTPGHVDFGGEVERVLKMANGCFLLVDAFEGPMPQTRFVLKKALETGLKPIVVINKIDRPDARVEAVEDEVLELFMELSVNDDTLDYPVVYASGRAGYATRDYKKAKEADSIIPLLDCIIENVEPPKGSLEGIAKMQITTLDYNDYVGRIGIGRIINGVFNTKSDIFKMRHDSVSEKCKILRLYGFRGVQRVEIEQAGAGDIVAVCGIDDLRIGDTLASELCDPEPVIEIDQPVISMTFAANTSPFSGRCKDSKYLTSRQIYSRLEKELETNVAMRLEVAEDSSDTFIVSGRGELHLGILIETMRREGYELQVSKPVPIYKKDENGQLLEPIEDLEIDIPEAYMGTIMENLGPRRAVMLDSRIMADNYLRLKFSVPSRGLLGFRSAFMTLTNGTGVMSQTFSKYEPYRGDIPNLRKGVMVATDTGKTTAYAIKNLSERGTLFYTPGEDVYEGLVVGERPVSSDIDVNIVKKRHVTNHRSATSEELERLPSPRIMTLDESLEYVADDEWVEITPEAIRIRKKGKTHFGGK